MGLRLFERHADGLRPTAAGRELVEAAERMEAEALRLERAVSGADDRAEGFVRITTIESFAAAFLADKLAPLTRQHPKLELELVTGDQMLNLTRSEADLALRYDPVQQEGIVARRLVDIGFGLYASPDYLTAHGRPKSVRDLRHHRMIGYDRRLSRVTEARWLDEQMGGQSYAFRSNSTLSMTSACAAGIGIAMLPCWLADVRPPLVRLFGPNEVARRAMALVMHGELRRVQRVRVVADHLVEIFRQHRKLLEDGAQAPT
jgi:DNA-binding transcriptional LysR family regulator